MSIQYDIYLKEHKKNVRKAFDWMVINTPELIPTKRYLMGTSPERDLEYQISFTHDFSKTEQDEYDAYDKYFYGNNKSHEVVENFNKAWLTHIHRNPHHWQYWILINDDPGNPKTLIEMPYNYILEMVCDWWSFGWSKNDLNNLFTWYDEHKEHIQLHETSRKNLEKILQTIKKKLEEEQNIVV